MLKFWAKNGKKNIFPQKQVSLKITWKWSLPKKINLQTWNLDHILPKTVKSRFWIFHIFLCYHSWSKFRHLERKTANSKKKMKISNVYFQTNFRRISILSDFEKFVSVKWAFLTILSSNFQNFIINAQISFCARLDARDKCF